MKEQAENHKVDCADAPSVIDVVDAFLECLSRTHPLERDLMMEYLRSKICMLCGASNPDCECYLQEAEMVQ